MAFLDLSHTGDTVLFSQKSDEQKDESEEIFSLELIDNTIQQLTDNDSRDLYPVWSPDDKQVAYLSWEDATLDIYVMDVNGDNSRLLYGSEYHDADLDWEENRIVFTRNSQIWIMDSDGSGARSVTNPPNAGEVNNANLPFGDYDPRVSQDGSQVLFARLVDDTSAHGNYDLFLIDIDGSNETQLTSTSFSQGIAQWSPEGDKIVYSVAAIQDEGKYDIYMINADSSENQNITPEYYPEDFLCYTPSFVNDDEIIFVGEWWE